MDRQCTSSCFTKRDREAGDRALSGLGREAAGSVRGRVFELLRESGLEQPGRNAVPRRPFGCPRSMLRRTQPRAATWSRMPLFPLRTYGSPPIPPRYKNPSAPRRYCSVTITTLPRRASSMPSYPESAALPSIRVLIQWILLFGVGRFSRQILDLIRHRQPVILLPSVSAADTQRTAQSGTFGMNCTGRPTCCCFSPARVDSGWRRYQSPGPAPDEYGC